MKKIYFTVTNDLSYDQRMIRICHSLASNGYSVMLVGRTQPGSIPLKKEPFGQRRLPCLFSHGKSFYLEYNTRLFFYLLFRKMDAICAIDLDTILPCLFIARLKKILRIYDAHELFSEMKEVLSRPAIKKTWDRVERYAVPRFAHGYTVSLSIAEEFRKRYGSDFAVIRNMPVLPPGEALSTDLSPSLFPAGLARAGVYPVSGSGQRSPRSRVPPAGHAEYKRQTVDLRRWQSDEPMQRTGQTRWVGR